MISKSCSVAVINTKQTQRVLAGWRTSCDIFKTSERDKVSYLCMMESQWMPKTQNTRSLQHTQMFSGPDGKHKNILSKTGWTLVLQGRFYLSPSLSGQMHVGNFTLQTVVLLISWIPCQISVALLFAESVNVVASTWATVKKTNRPSPPQMTVCVADRCWKVSTLLMCE